MSNFKNPNYFLIKEFQGYTPTESRSRLIYEFEKEQEEEVEEETAKSWTFTAASPHKISPTKTKSPVKISRHEATPFIQKKINCPKNQPSKEKLPFSSDKGLGLCKKPTSAVLCAAQSPKSFAKPCSPDKSMIQKSKNPENRTISVQELAAQFDSPRVAPKDPAEMTIMERKALFERNRTKDGHSSGLKTVSSKNFQFSSKSPSQGLKSTANHNLYSGKNDKTIVSHANVGSGRMKSITSKIDRLI